MVHIMNIRPDKQRTGEITTNGIPYQLIQQIIQVNGLLITGLSEKTIRKFMSCDFKMALRQHSYPMISNVSGTVIMMQAAGLTAPILI